MLLELVSTDNFYVTFGASGGVRWFRIKLWRLDTDYVTWGPYFSQRAVASRRLLSLIEPRPIGRVLGHHSTSVLQVCGREGSSLAR